MSAVEFAWPGRQPFSLKIDTFVLPARQRFLLLGPSGSGKSTFLSLICGINAPKSGAVRVLDTDLASLAGSARDRFRAGHIGIIFQMFNLLPYGSILDNVVLPLSFAAGRQKRAAGIGSASAEAVRLLGRLGLDMGQLQDHSSSDLSVGQQQRVAVARALIGRPELIVADEPTSALDRDHRARFLELLFAEIEEAQASLIMVSHDQELGPLFDQIVRLEDVARIAWGGPP
jgi:putative ABC transport system ATP-binding protein